MTFAESRERVSLYFRVRALGIEVDAFLQNVG
jgi:hypothetical protein